MTPGNVRTIEELSQLYTLHPERRDIYVEGPEDVYFFQWFLRESAKDNAVVYEISTVDIPKTVVAKYNGPDNNRFRIIALAEELEAVLGKDIIQVTCIVDRDFDIVLNINHPCTLLLFTDYTCVEMYCFTSECLEKFFTIFLLGFPYSSSHTLAQLEKPLQELFLIRLANESMALSLKRIEPDKCCTIGNGLLTFDSDDFVCRYLNSNAMLSKKGIVLAYIKSMRPRLTEDPRNQIQGHDFIHLLSLYLKKHGIPTTLSHQTVVQRALLICADYRTLIRERLFTELLARL